MTTQPDPEERSAQDRWNTIKALWKRDQWLYVLAGFLAGLLVSPLVQSIQTDGGEFARSLVPEAIGIGFTVLLIDRLYRRREDQREERELKERLIRELGSRDNAIANHAAYQLRTPHDWLSDGSLQGVMLYEANLQEADLGGINLERSSITGVNFQFANLAEAKLNEVEFGRSIRFRGSKEMSLHNNSFKQANLFNAELKRAELFWANFEMAVLWYADLQGANLRIANLRGADLRSANLTDANLQDADLTDADLDEATLPDKSKGTSGIDMSRFTNPEHPQFWRSNNPNSPAYWGKVDEAEPSE